MIEQQAGIRDELQAALHELMVNDEEAAIQFEAAVGLAALGSRSPDVVDKLVAALAEGDDVTRRSAVRALGRTGDMRATHRLLSTLEESPELWEDVAAALPDVIDADTAASLLSVIRSTSALETRRGAIRALVEASAVAPASIEARPVYEDEVGLHPLF